MQPTKSHYFFISYASGDKNESEDYIPKFFNDLSKEVSTRVSEEAPTVGFIDAKNIEVGDEWPEALQAGLQSSRVMVSLYSTKYFNSPYCGREWQVFRLRQQAHMDANKSNPARPTVFLPVLWAPAHSLPKTLPEAVASIQHDHNSFGDEYAKEGLRYLMLRDVCQDAYKEFLTRLADRIVKVSNEPSLAPLRNFPSLQMLDSAFVIRNQMKVASGPNIAELVFVAAGRDELKAIEDKRTNLVFYGDSGFDWRPYHPEAIEDIWSLAQRIADQADFRSRPMNVDASLIDQLRKARVGNSVVVIIVDAWALLLDSYAERMREYDQNRFANSVVLVLWNPQDEETTKYGAALEAAISDIFYNICVTKEKNFYPTIDSKRELEEKLKASLIEIRLRIINRGNVFKRANGDRVITQPIISAAPEAPLNG